LTGDGGDGFKPPDLQPLGPVDRYEINAHLIRRVDAILGQINGEFVCLEFLVVVRVGGRTYEHGRYKDDMVSAAEEADIDGIGDFRQESAGIAADLDLHQGHTSFALYLNFIGSDSSCQEPPDSREKFTVVKSAVKCYDESKLHI